MVRKMFESKWFNIEEIIWKLFGWDNEEWQKKKILIGVIIFCFGFVVIFVIPWILGIISMLCSIF